MFPFFYQFILSTLFLFMLGVFADHHDFSFAFDNLTLFANGSHGWSYFHPKTSLPMY